MQIRQMQIEKNIMIWLLLNMHKLVW